MFCASGNNVRVWTGHTGDCEPLRACELRRLAVHGQQMIRLQFPGPWDKPWVESRAKRTENARTASATHARSRCLCANEGMPFDDVLPSGAHKSNGVAIDGGSRIVVPTLSCRAENFQTCYENNLRPGKYGALNSLIGIYQYQAVPARIYINIHQPPA